MSSSDTDITDHNYNHIFYLMRYLLLSLLGLQTMLELVVCAEDQIYEANFLLDHITLIFIISLSILVLGFIYYDARNGYLFIRTIRDKLAKCKHKIINLKKYRGTRKQQQSINDDPPPTSKQFFDSQKSFSEAQGNSIQQTISSPSNKQVIQSIQIIEKTPQVNLKDVFQSKQSENNSSNKKKSKSKLLNRVQYRKSQITQQSPKPEVFVGVQQANGIQQ